MEKHFKMQNNSPLMNKHGVPAGNMGRGDKKYPLKSLATHNQIQ